METIKFVIVGDGNVGKTCLFFMYTTNTYPEEYKPTIITSYSMISSYQNRPCRLEFWDTAGQEDCKNLRSLIVYAHTDVFLVCFSIVEPSSFWNAEKLWNEEIRNFCPNAIVILVGTKIDLRHDEAVIENLRKSGRSTITYDQGEQLAKKIKAYKYLECSALKNIGLKEIFNNSLLAFVERKKGSIGQKSCSIL